MDNTTAIMFINQFVYSYVFMCLMVVFPYWLIRITILK